MAALTFVSIARAASGTTDECAAYAGTITTDSTQQCLVNGAATLVAVPGGDAVVPPGFQLGYILTSSNGLTIEQVGPDPVFTVSTVNIWRIHSLVYDPATLDFSAILDLDHAYQLQEMLVQGGGAICASLNTGGAGTKTTVCEEEPCTADAGSINALNPDLCLTDGEAQLEAAPDGNAVVPDGFSVVFVLTTGPDLTILATGVEPSFTVNFEGPFIIHTLVYDPATLDLSGIVPGETSAFEILALLQQGGGPICGSLDTAGTQFQVADCDPVCDAYAGTMTPVESEVCLVDGIADIDATPNGDAVVPDGYSTAYILARANGIIENVEPFTLFEWPLTGEYVIHTIVYDPFTIDPYDVILGSTTIQEINAVLIQGGGPVCASLDLDGAPVTVIDCAPPCDDDAGIGGDVLLCFTDPVVDLFSLLTGTPEEGGSWSGPDGQPSGGSFNPATDAQGIYVYFVTDGPDCPGDTTQLVITLIECPGPCDADAGPDASAVFCSNQPLVDLGTLLNGDAGGSWTDPAGQLTSGIFVPGVSEPGTYTYVVGASDVCDGDTALVLVSVVQAPDAGTNATVSFCTTDPPAFCIALLGGDPQIDGTWTGPNGVPFDGTFDPATDPPGLYQYTVPGQAPCPAATAVLAIIVVDCCDAGVDADTTVCFTDPSLVMIDLLGGNPCPGGVWADPADQAHSGVFNPALDISGTYTYTVVNSNGSVDQSTLTINVIECPSTCEADAGTIGTDTPEPCLQGGSAQLAATSNGDAVIPPGFISAFLLSTGPELTLQSFGNAPVFAANSPGIHTIHTVVYDFTTWDLSGIVWGTTTVSEVAALFIQGGGNVCANIDVAGAQFLVSECTDPCAESDPDAGIGGDVLRCTVDPPTELFDMLQGTPDPGGFWTAPDGSMFPGVFDPLADAPGVYVYTVFDLADCEPDTTQLNIQVIVCEVMNENLAGWPNPAVEFVSFQFPAPVGNAAGILVLDALGRRCSPPISIDGRMVTVDVSALPAGSYSLRMIDAGRAGTGRFIRGSR